MRWFIAWTFQRTVRRRHLDGGPLTSACRAREARARCRRRRGPLSAAAGPPLSGKKKSLFTSSRPRERDRKPGRRRRGKRPATDFPSGQKVSLRDDWSMNTSTSRWCLWRLGVLTYDRRPLSPSSAFCRSRSSSSHGDRVAALLFSPVPPSVKGASAPRPLNRLVRTRQISRLAARGSFWVLLLTPTACSSGVDMC